MISLDNIIKDNNDNRNEKWPYIPNHSYRILITGGSDQEKQTYCLI